MVTFASAALLLFADLLCGTWNLKWFPSGRAEHRAPAHAEQTAISQAAAAIKEGLDARPGMPAVVFLQELRDENACARLVSATGRTNLTIASVSAFLNRDRRLAWQQLAIATTLPVLDSSWSKWKGSRGVYPPRGYAYALLDGGPDGKIACFCLHLKSNYGASNPKVREENRAKREICARQIADIVKSLRKERKRKTSKIIVAGDFNADAFRIEDGEKTFEIVDGAGLSGIWKDVPAGARGTHPSRSPRWPDSTLDYIFWSGFASAGDVSLAPALPVSDHRLVWAVLK